MSWQSDSASVFVSRSKLKMTCLSYFHYPVITEIVHTSYSTHYYDPTIAQNVCRHEPVSQCTCSVFPMWHFLVSTPNGCGSTGSKIILCPACISICIVCFQKEQCHAMFIFADAGFILVRAKLKILISDFTAELHLNWRENRFA